MRTPLPTARVTDTGRSMPPCRSRRHGPGLVIGVTLLAACGGDAGVPPALVRDSAGITIIENHAPDSTAVAWWRIEPAPQVDIGGADAAETDALFQVTDARRLADGRIVVVQAGGADVRFYDAAGAHLRTTGRRGGGPGEFQRPTHVREMGDSLVVFDVSARRMSVLGPDGSFVRDFTVGGTATSPGQLIGRSPDGRLLTLAGVSAGGPSEPQTGLVRPDAAVLVFTADGVPADTVGLFPGAERMIRVTQSGGQITSISIAAPPFARETVVALHGDEVYVSTQDAAEIRVYGLDRALRRILRTGVAVRPVTKTHVDAWIERSVAQARPENQAAVRAGLEALPAGSFIPPHGAMRADRDGNLWVADYDDRITPAGAWTVYGAAGAVRARVRLPPRFRLLDTGAEWVLGVELDDFDAEHVRLYRLHTGN